MAATDGFDALMADLDPAMLIVTVRAGGRRDGCLIGFSTQASIGPPRFLACLSENNRTYRIAAQGAEHLAVHAVPATGHRLAEVFGGETGDEVDKLAQVAWHEGPHGLPILDDCPSWMVGRVLQRTRLGDHFGFLLEPVAVHHGRSSEPLRFHAAKGIDPGHEA